MLNDNVYYLKKYVHILNCSVFSLQIISEVADSGKLVPGVARLKALNDRVALARSLLADTGMLVAREDLALEAAFWAQLPGNFPFPGRERRP